VSEIAKKKRHDTKQKCKREKKGGAIKNFSLQRGQVEIPEKIGRLKPVLNDS
jgi:hypothetical protein